MTEYIFKKIETKWQTIWDEREDYRTNTQSLKPKCFLLVEFPYPSGAGLHVGHPRSYIAMDVIARKRRMEGSEVLFTIGFDAFGLPAENYAISTGVHPRVTTEQNINNFRRQLKMLGLSFDWEREINTTDPNYYQWTQWMFLRMFKAGLAYKTDMPINWCPSCNTALANEEVEGGICERCKTAVVRRQKKQWMLRITKYADRLIEDLDSVDYIKPVVDQQRNWIGRSYGVEINFPLLGADTVLTVFTTRPDTIFGATYIVIAPEHPLIIEHASSIRNMDEILAYQQDTASKSDLRRMEVSEDKTGVRLIGLEAFNQVTGKRIPIWISDYVLMNYGHGSVMAVPAHDTRDWDFARKFGLPVIEVVKGGDVAVEAYVDVTNGVMVNSGFLNGMKVEEAIVNITKWLERNNIGRPKTSYRLRDWIFSRQRYWGEPIPLVYCQSCGWVPIPESELPLVLPEICNFTPAGDGIAPLANVRDWVETICPKCSKPAERETDTMPQWAGSCWYYLRYIDPHNKQAFADPKLLSHWLPVDWYNGGMEHTTLHLLYSRFWHKFLYDEGLVPTMEPYQRRTSHGMILGADHEKMSKSRGNVVNPDQVVSQFGVDSFRVYEMFLGEFDNTAIWSDQGLIGCHRFLKRIWHLAQKYNKTLEVTIDEERLIARVIRDVSDRTERMKFNTAISALMEYVNEFSGRNAISKKALETLCILLYPYAPHIAEEIWTQLGYTMSLSTRAWPKAELEFLKQSTFVLAMQINGKIRDSAEVVIDLSQDDLVTFCLQRPTVAKYVSRTTLKRVVYVPGKIINLIC
jgi:leucyl-tRNA synthetase